MDSMGYKKNLIPHSSHPSFTPQRERERWVVREISAKGRTRRWNPRRWRERIVGEREEVWTARMGRKPTTSGRSLVGVVLDGGEQEVSPVMEGNDVRFGGDGVRVAGSGFILCYGDWKRTGGDMEGGISPVGGGCDGYGFVYMCVCVDLFLQLSVTPLLLHLWVITFWQS